MLLHFSHLLFYIFIGGADTTAGLSALNSQLSTL